MSDEDTLPTPPPATEPTILPPEARPSVEAAPAEAPPAEPQTAQIPVSEPLPSEPAPALTQVAPAQATSTTARPDSRQYASDRLVMARASIQDRKRNKIDKIMEVLTTKDKVTNDEVEKLLHVSDATATRYLSALEKDGKIKQVGKTGMGVVYTKV